VTCILDSVGTARLNLYDKAVLFLFNLNSEVLADEGFHDFLELFRNWYVEPFILIDCFSVEIILL